MLRDVSASLVVFLVALPLCMGVAIASGMPPAAGIVTGILGGIVVGAISGAPLQVSGPAAGLTVLVWDIVQNHGPSTLGIAVLIAGVAQTVIGVLRLGRWFQAVPPSVVQGMLAGIGALILLSQVHVMLDDQPRGGGLQNLYALDDAVRSLVNTPPDAPHRIAGSIGIATIVLIVLWTSVVAKRVEWLRRVPGVLVSVVSVTAIVDVLELPVALVTLPEDLRTGLSLPTREGLATLLSPGVVGMGLALAAIASAETLLCASAVDRMHAGPRTRYDRELFAQGIGNTLCGVLGVLPMTGVIVRSTANVEAGATTRLSTILHGAWLLLLVMFAPFVLRTIPVCALAAVLVYTGAKLLFQDVRPLIRAGRFEVFVFATTVLSIVVFDLLTGVLLGIGLAGLRLLDSLGRLRTRVEVPANGPVQVVLSGAATFVRLPQLLETLDAIPAAREVHVRLDRLEYVDHAAMDALVTWEKQLTKNGGTVTIDWSGLSHAVKPSREAPAPALEPCSLCGASSGRPPPPRTDEPVSTPSQ